MSVSRDNERMKTTDRSIISTFTETGILTLEELSSGKTEKLLRWHFGRGGFPHLLWARLISACMVHGQLM